MICQCLADQLFASAFGEQAPAGQEGNKIRRARNRSMSEAIGEPEAKGG